jgi:transposase
MLPVDERERIRRAYYVEHKPKRQIARELGHARTTVDKALTDPAGAGYHLNQPRPAPVLGPVKAQIDAWLIENETLPRKQRYTSHLIFQKLRTEHGFTGGESTVRGYISRERQRQRRPAVFLPLEFDPGQDAQVDWGEAEVELAGERVTVQLFVMRLCYSRRLFVMAFPTQKQEAFFEGQVQAFHAFGGVPHTLTYDNLGSAVTRVLVGRDREVNPRFIAFRSHYLFASRFCTPGEGHEKGGVEHGVGYARRNFLAGCPAFASFEALNAHLRAACEADERRQPDGWTRSIGAAFADERPHLQPLPAHDFAWCVSRPVALNPYSQVTFETNRYSVPVEAARPHLTLKAYPFRIEVWDDTQLLTTHPRSYQRDQDVFDPQHYLALLEQRPGAFEHARPLREWRKTWPAVYEALLTHLRSRESEPRSVREFVLILKLHRDYPAAEIAQAIQQALSLGRADLEGVRLCLHQLHDLTPPAARLDLSTRPHLAPLGQQPLSLAQYDQLLAGEAEP